MLMHGGRAGFVADFDRFAACRFEPGLTARLAARLRGHALDRALIEGADPAATEQLAARAARLTSTSMRREVARGLDRLARDGREAPKRWQVRPFKRAAAANAPELHALAARLREPGPLYARGIAMLSRLLTEGTGPAYADSRGDLLAQRLHDAREAMGA
ncbi:MAG TPA: hypothetical protein VFI54_14660 [Solirubrobacteraceae bacterium]|nr:hypothetical protein [Solirubrobacteraceae bacterium]